MTILAPKIHQNRLLEASWGTSWSSGEPLEASLRPLRGLLGHLNLSWRRLSEVLRRFEASSRPLRGGGRIGPATVPAVLRGSLDPAKRPSCIDPRHLKGIHIVEMQLKDQLLEPTYALVRTHGGRLF